MDQNYISLLIYNNKNEQIKFCNYIPFQSDKKLKKKKKKKKKIIKKN